MPTCVCVSSSNVHECDSLLRWLGALVQLRRERHAAARQQAEADRDRSGRSGRVASAPEPTSEPTPPRATYPFSPVPLPAADSGAVDEAGSPGGPFEAPPTRGPAPRTGPWTDEELVGGTSYYR